MKQIIIRTGVACLSSVYLKESSTWWFVSCQRIHQTDKWRSPAHMRAGEHPKKKKENARTKFCDAQTKIASCAHFVCFVPIIARGLFAGHMESLRKKRKKEVCSHTTNVFSRLTWIWGVSGFTQKFQRSPQNKSWNNEENIWYVWELIYVRNVCNYKQC